MRTNNCKNCTNRHFDPERGIICQLNPTESSHVEQCPQYIMDTDLKKEEPALPSAESFSVILGMLTIMSSALLFVPLFRFLKTMPTLEELTSHLILLVLLVVILINFVLSIMAFSAILGQKRNAVRLLLLVCVLSQILLFLYVMNTPNSTPFIWFSPSFIYSIHSSFFAIVLKIINTTSIVAWPTIIILYTLLSPKMRRFSKAIRNSK